MTTIATTNHAAQVLERVITVGDLKDLAPADRIVYYRSVCESVGLNPLTKPFEFLSLSGKLVLYANKSCAEQLRKLHNVSLTIIERQVIEHIYIVTAKATLAVAAGVLRVDESTGAVNLQGLTGESKANAMMKAETKAKRRVTLSICGLGIMDETEVADLPGADTDLTADGEPDPVAIERRRLYAEIIAVADRLGLKPEERKAAWKEHLREAKPETADPSALQDLLTALEERESGARV